MNESSTNKPIFWLTGYSGAGKTTLAKILQKRLSDTGHPTVVLDGDELRAGLSSDLAFSKQDRIENTRRCAEIAKILSRNGIISIVALITPYKQCLDIANDIASDITIHIIHVYADIETCKDRDPKGLYKKACVGIVTEMTGVSRKYEPPIRPHFTIDTRIAGTDECSKDLEEFILKNLSKCTNEAS